MFKLIVVLLVFNFINLSGCQENALLKKVLAKAEHEMKLVAKGYILPLEILREFDSKVEKDKYIYLYDICGYFFKAAKMGNLVALKYFENKDYFSLDIHDNDGTTALHQAMYDNNQTTCDFLLKSDEDDEDGNGNFRLMDIKGRNCLMFINGCTGYKDCDNPFVIKTIKKILDFGLDVNFSDDSGKTPLMYHADNLKVVDLLLSYGADIELKDNAGKTFLHYFCKSVFELSEYEIYQKITKLNEILRRNEVNCFLV